MISVIIPTFNDAAHLPRALAPLVPGVSNNLVKQAIICDGGSTDETLEIAEAAGCDIVVSEKGRAKQLRAGAAVAKGKWLLFLHPDTALGAGWLDEAKLFMDSPLSRKRAAAFRLALDDDSRQARRTLFWARLRARVMKLPYGDQGLLISRFLYHGVGGYPDIPMMEDVEIARRIGPRRIVLFDTPAITSAEKYQRDRHGRSGLRNTLLLGRYLMGADPIELANAYE